MLAGIHPGQTLDRVGQRSVLGDHPQTAGPLGHEPSALRQGRDAPGMLEPLHEGLRRGPGCFQRRRAGLGLEGRFEIGCGGTLLDGLGEGAGGQKQKDERAAADHLYLP